MILLTVQLKVRPNKQREFLQNAETVLNETRAIHGCIDCKFYQEYGVEDRFCFLQEWDSTSLVNQYLLSDSLGLLLGAAKVLTEPAEIKLDITRGGMEVVKMVRGR